MVKSLSKNKSFLSFLLFGVTALFILFYFNDFVLHLNNWNFGASEDMLKNVFTFKEYIKHGDGFYLKNINYPFGEHVLYTDAQPALAIICKYLGLETYSTFLLHFLMLLSICICSVLVFSILLKLKLPIAYSFVFALLISLFSPQIPRILGHYGLSYGMYIPLLFYIFLVPERSITIKSIILFVVILFFSFVHPYYLAIGLLFCLSFILFSFLARKISRKEFFVSMSFILLSVVVFKSIMLLSDTVTDRPDMPYGHWAYRSTFSGVFIAHAPPFNNLFKALGYRYHCEGESIAYVGIMGIPFLLFSVFMMTKNIRKKRKRFVRLLFLEQHLNILLAAAFITWLVACYYPFRLGLEFLIPYTGPYKQFRGLGRIGWIFYYAVVIAIVYYAYVIYRAIHRKYKIAAGVFLFVVIFLFYMDVNGHLNHVKSLYQKHETDMFQEDNELTTNISKIDLTKYDAVLTLPLFCVGNEHLYYSGDQVSQQSAYYMAYRYNKPFVSLEASRSSWSQSYMAIQLLSNKLIAKEIMNFIEPHKKLLIISEKKAEDSTIWLIRQSKFLMSTQHLNFYAFDFDELRKPILLEDNYVDFDSLNKSKPLYPLYYNDFSSMSNNHKTLFSNKVEVKDYKEIYASTLNLQDSVLMEFSCWSLMGPNKKSMANYVIDIVDRNKELRQYRINQDIEHYNLYHEGARREKSFPLYPLDSQIHIYAEGSEVLFNVMLKPADLHVKMKTSEKQKIMYDNFEVVQ